MHERAPRQPISELALLKRFGPRHCKRSMIVESDLQPGNLALLKRLGTRVIVATDLREIAY